MFDFLKSLKAGDSVIRSGASIYGGASVEVVERVTPTMIVLKSGERFDKKWGHPVGDRPKFCTVTLCEATADMLVKIRTTQELRRLQNVDWRNVDAATRRRICYILHEAEAATPAPVEKA